MTPTEQLSTIGLSFHYVNEVFDLLLLPLNENGSVIASKNEESSLRDWQPVIDRILSSLHRFNGALKFKHKAPNHQEDPWIYIVLIEPAQLSSKAFFDHIPKWEIRRIVQPEDRVAGTEPNGRYNPIISVSHEDFVEMDTEMDKQAQKPQDALLHSLKIDPRAKFLDASIWHRYLPELPHDELFDTCLTDVLDEIMTHWADGLYYTVAAITTLEFQTRMLLHSYIGNFGEGGHAEIVTPFKFFSERHMQKKAFKEAGFFTAKWNNSSLIDALELRCLVVDDFAKPQLSTIKNKPCSKNKVDLIRRPIDLLLSDRKRKTEVFHLDVPSKEENIIAYCTSQMAKQTYDLIFLDYLLGSRKGESNEREYGYEFLLGLIQENRAQNTPLLRHDFMGRYWIFPVSSFPFALSDKLIQLGVGHLHSIWHLSGGGDPVSTPHLYSFYLYRFLKQKVGEYFLHPKALKRLINETPVFQDSPKDAQRWANCLDVAFQLNEIKLQVINESVKDSSHSPFLRTIERFIRTQIRLKILLKPIRDIIDVLKQDSSKTDYEQIDRSRKAIEGLLQSDFKEYRESMQGFMQRMDLYTSSKKIKNALARINDALSTKSAFLFLDRLSLKTLPQLKQLSHFLNELSVEHNNLTALPQSIQNLSELKELSLGHNQISDGASLRVLLQLDYLEDLDLSNNPLVENIESKHAKTRDEVIALLNEVLNIKEGKTLLPINTVVRIFISYAREDARYREELFKHLASLHDNLHLEIYYDYKLLSSKPWRQQINQWLEAAHIFLFLTTADSLTSEFIRNEEIPVSLSRHQAHPGKIMIIPIILKACVWKNSVLSKFTKKPVELDHVLKQQRNRDGIWVKIVEELQEEIGRNFPASLKT